MHLSHVYSRVLQHRYTFYLSWLVALSGTVMTLFLMLTPDTSPIVNVPHKVLGGTDTSDSIGHVILFCALVVSWWAFAAHFSSRRSLLAAAVIVFVLGTFTELAQSIVPHRGAGWLDLF